MSSAHFKKAFPYQMENQVFFVVAPEGLGYYFFEPLSDGDV